MTTWEYCRVGAVVGSYVVNSAAGSTKVEKTNYLAVLDDLGGQGWEAFAVDSSGSVLMKRPT